MTASPEANHFQIHDRELEGTSQALSNPQADVCLESGFLLFQAILSSPVSQMPVQLDRRNHESGTVAENDET